MTDEAGAVTAYGYDEAGRLAAVTNALGNVVNYGYNARGQKVAEGGAVYPVQYGYDAFGQKVTMETFRDEAAETGDISGTFQKISREKGEEVI
ncbi:MAG: RHS repeat domain-containing protein [Candidatus Spyradenecus sp.]